MQNENPKEFLFGKKAQKDGIEQLVDTWHYMMYHYGYFSFEEFLDMDPKIIGMLVERLNELNKKTKEPQGRFGRNMK